MKEGWVYRLFKDVFPIKMGKTPPRSDSSSWDKKKETQNYWVSIADISQNEGNIIYDTKEYITDKAAEKIFKVKANSLLMSFKLTIGKMAFAGTDLYTNEAIIAIPENKEYNLKFLYFYLSSYNWSSLTDGNEKVKGKTLNKESIGRIKLPIISLSDQQRIVSYLDSEFAKIEALKANAEKQFQAAKDLFQAALKELLTPKEGWVNGILSDIAIIMHGKNQKDVQNELGQYPIYGSGGTIMGYADDYLCEAGTTILGRKGTINNPQYIGTRFWNVDTAFGISAKYDNDNKFLFYLIKLEDWTKRNTGTTLPSLTQTVIANVPISFPLKGEQQRIADRLDALSANVKALQSNYTETITLCNDLKQALLKKVFE